MFPGKRILKQLPEIRQTLIEIYKNVWLFLILFVNAHWVFIVIYFKSYIHLFQTGQIKHHSAHPQGDR